MDARDDLARKVEALHGAHAVWERSERVQEEMQGRTVWEREVEIFTLSDHPTAKLAFAWMEPVPGSTRVRFFAVLQVGPIETARDAVRASIITDARGGRKQ